MRNFHEMNHIQRALHDAVNLDVIWPVVQQLHSQHNLLGDQQKEFDKQKSHYETVISNIQMEKQNLSHELQRHQLLVKDFESLEQMVKQLHQEKATMAEHTRKKELELEAKAKLVNDLKNEKLGLEKQLKEKQTLLDVIKVQVQEMLTSKKLFEEKTQSILSESHRSVENMKTEKSKIENQLQLKQVEVEKMVVKVNRLINEKQEIAQKEQTIRAQYVEWKNSAAQLSEEKAQLASENRHQKAELAKFMETHTKYNKLKEVIRDAIEDNTVLNPANIRLSQISQPAISADEPRASSTQSMESVRNTRRNTDALSNRRDKNMPYTCLSCSKQYDKEASYKRHLLTHKAAFPCESCDKVFKQSNDLMRHMRTHNGEKPFPCSKCDKSFSQKIHLKKHLDTHTQE